MNKIAVITFLFFSTLICAQDTLVVTKKPAITYTQKEIQVDNEAIPLSSFPKKFKEKYKGDEFIYEYKTSEKNAWERFKEWLSGIFKRLFNFGSNETSQSFVNIFLRILAIAVVVFVIYLIVKAIMNKEGSWIFGKNSDKKVINYEEVEKNIHTIDFEKLIKSTLASGEKRLSIRYYYLWLLKKMSDKEIILWDIEKTNTDYLYEIKNQILKEEFGYLSYLYNYIWYGEFELDDTTFEKAKSSFEKNIQSLK